MNEPIEPATPATDIAAELAAALRRSDAAMREYYRYWTGGETRGSYDGKPERSALWDAMHKNRAALAKWEASQ
jgi:hypothetical protein